MPVGDGAGLASELERLGLIVRPLGASIGDYMSQAKVDGGLGLGPTVTSFIFLGTILALVIYLAVTKRDQLPPVDADALVDEDAPVDAVDTDAGSGRHS